MANIDAPFGLRPVGDMNGGVYTGAIREYYVPSSDSTAIFLGDPVVITGNSNTSTVLGRRPRMLSEVTRATMGDANAITGYVVGVIPVTRDSTIYREASTERILQVCDDRRVLLEVQADGSVSADDVGLNANLIATHSGSTVTGLSGIELDTTSDVPAADASNQVTIIGFKNSIDNDPTSANPIVLVRTNNHTLNDGAIGIA